MAVHSRLAKLTPEKRKDVELMLRMVTLAEDKEVGLIGDLHSKYLDAVKGEKGL